MARCWGSQVLCPKANGMYHISCSSRIGLSFLLRCADGAGGKNKHKEKEKLEKEEEEVPRVPPIVASNAIAWATQSICGPAFVTHLRQGNSYGFSFLFARAADKCSNTYTLFSIRYHLHVLLSSISSTLHSPPLNSPLLCCSTRHNKTPGPRLAKTLP